MAPFAERCSRRVRRRVDPRSRRSHSEQTCPQAMTDPDTCTSLVNTRLLAGSKPLYQTIPPVVPQTGQPPQPAVDSPDRASRQIERLRFGDTCSCSNPTSSDPAAHSAKCSLSAGSDSSVTAPPISTNWREMGILINKDLAAIKAAKEFLLRIHNELHFHAAQAAEVLNRAEQLRIAEPTGIGRPAACCRSNNSCGITSATPRRSAT